MKVATVEDIKRLDEFAANRFGISRLLLMENAANAVKNVVEIEFGIEDLNVVVLAGPGNNGGDGIAAARLLHSNGSNIDILLLADEKKFKGGAKVNLDIAKKIGLNIYRIKTKDELNKYLNNGDLIIDAIFGTGLNREVGGIYREAINSANKSNRPILSIDIPSGVNGDTGKIMGIAIQADITVTFGLPKIGLFLYPGAEHVGKLYLSHISYPKSLLESPELFIELNEPLRLPPRRKDTHKGDYGRCLFIAGSRMYMGAPYLSAYSFLIAGGGMSYLATVESIIHHIVQKGSEIIQIPLLETRDGVISRDNIDHLLKISDIMDFIVIGPGLGISKDTEELLTNLVLQMDKPILIDGDGITLLSKHIDILKKMKKPIILTPHPGEMSRLINKPINEIKRDKINIVRKFSSKYHVYTVLKGANTVIGYPDGKIYINTSGNPGMATAGSGDVLSGIIPAFYCQGLNIGEAVRFGVFIHGVAGDIAAEKYGEPGVTASRIMRSINPAINYIEKNFKEVIETCYYTIWKI